MPGLLVTGRVANPPERNPGFRERGFPKQRNRQLITVNRQLLHKDLNMSILRVWPIIVYGVLIFVLVGGILVLSYLLGERHRAPGRNQPYESGIQPTGSARVRYGAPYYLVGLFFVLFDIEAAFVFAWAVAARELGWPGYIAMVLFIATLVAGLVYVWKMGALDWYPGLRRRRGGDAP